MVKNSTPEGHILITLDIDIHLLAPIIHLDGWHEILRLLLCLKSIFYFFSS